MDDVKATVPVTTRRATARTGLRGAARVLLPGDVTREVEMHDLSGDGLSVTSSRPISPGTRCSIAFEVPAGDQRPARRLTVPAKAVYSSYVDIGSFRVGMIFIALDIDAQRAIEAFTRG